MIKKLMDWITGKSDAVATPVPYKVETPTTEAMPIGIEAVMVAPAAVVPEAVIPAAAIETAPVTVKAKYKKADLTKMTKAELMELVTKHGVEVKARSTKEELVKVLAKV
jgi:hypothetical protein